MCLAGHTASKVRAQSAMGGVCVTSVRSAIAYSCSCLTAPNSVVGPTSESRDTSSHSKNRKEFTTL